MRMWLFDHNRFCRDKLEHPDSVVLRLDRRGASDMIARLAEALRARDEDWIDMPLSGQLRQMKEPKRD